MKYFKLIIPCFFETKETDILENIGKDVDIKEYKILDVTLYQCPSSLSPYLFNGEEKGTHINVGNEQYVSSLMVSEIELLIDLEITK